MTQVIFVEEQMETAGACQGYSIEHINKQNEKNLFILTRWVGGGVTE